MRTFTKLMSGAAAITVGSTLLVGATTSAQATTAGDDVGVLHWSCGRAAPADNDRSNHHWVEREDSPAYMRVGSSTRCALNGGMAYYLESLDYHCFTWDINGVDSWTYVQNAEAPSEQGWINDDHLNDGGSTVRCAGDTAPVG